MMHHFVLVWNSWYGSLGQVQHLADSPVYSCAGDVLQDGEDLEAAGPELDIPGGGPAACVPSSFYRPQHAHHPRVWLPQCGQVQLH